MKRFILLLLSCLLLASGSYATTWDGNGSVGDAYIIDDCNKLQSMENYTYEVYLANMGNAPRARHASQNIYFELENDIDCTTISSAPFGDFNSISSASGSNQHFAGHLDGNGHYIRNLSIHGQLSGEGAMFAVLADGGSVRNVGLIDFNIWNIGFGAAALVFETLDTGFDGGHVENVFVRGGHIATGSGIDVAGIMSRAQSDTNIVNCYVEDTVLEARAANFGGGIVARIVDDANIFHSYSNAPVSINGADIGGVVGDIGLGSPTCNGLYWDTETSGVPTDACITGSTGKTCLKTFPPGMLAHFEFKVRIEFIEHCCFQLFFSLF